MATTYEPIEYDPTKYAVNYDDERFTSVKEEEADLLGKAQESYGERAAGVDKVYESLKESTQKWADTQTDIQNQQTNQIITELEQQKGYAQKDYEKEQAGAYVDWRKQSNQYGSEAEKMAASGLAKTGYSESSQVSMYNAYQNRVAVARESFQRTCDNFANQIANAKIQNNAALAEIALTAMEKAAEYDLQAFLHKDQLLSELFDREMQIREYSDNKWYKALDQVNLENSRLFEHEQQQNQFAFEATQADIEREWKAEHDKAMAEIQQAYQKELDKINHDYDLALVKANTQAAKEKADHDHKLALEKAKKEYEYQKGLKDKELANAKALAKYESDLAKQKTTFKTGSTGISSKTAAAAKKVLNPSYNFNSKSSNNYESQIKNITTYSQAGAFAKKLGATFGAMTLSEWSRRKNAGSTATEMKYKSYEAYIQDYCRYLASKSKK